MSRQQANRMRSLLTDGRSGRVVFLSHCLLNQNTRYPGGARYPGVAVDAVEPYLHDGVGIVQMECPEQRVWGGVLKRRYLWLIDHPRIAGLSAALSKLVSGYLRLRYRGIAARVVRGLDDYLKSGFEVIGVVGVAGSPSCGVDTTLDLGRALKAIGSCPLTDPSTDWINRSVVAGSTVPGQGQFIAALAASMERRSIRVPFDEVNLSHQIR